MPRRKMSPSELHARQIYEKHPHLPDGVPMRKPAYRTIGVAWNPQTQRLEIQYEASDHDEQGTQEENQES